MKYYAGIGSRATPPDMMEYMTHLASRLEDKGFTLRSGAANGADTAFENGVKKEQNKDIFLPWKGFNNSSSPLFQISKDALSIGAAFHPKWNYLSQGAQKLHARNAYQVLGYSLDTPVDFVVCWTPDGAETAIECSINTGGTGTAIKIADNLDIQVYNLKNKSSITKLEQLISNL